MEKNIEYFVYSVIPYQKWCSKSYSLNQNGVVQDSLFVFIYL